ncbi:MAG: hypothetical protein ACK5PW_05125 [Burkholderiales bacterium]|jgi:hypothetical protein
MPDATDSGFVRELNAAVAATRTDTVRMLSELVALPSLLGDEASAQGWMADTLGTMGLRVDRFDIDEAKLTSHRRWSPSVVSFDGRPNVVGVHRPRESRGRSLILNASPGAGMRCGARTSIRSTSTSASCRAANGRPRSPPPASPRSACRSTRT